jgi:hypothetical protein
MVGKGVEDSSERLPKMVFVFGMYINTRGKRGRGGNRLHGGLIR